MIDQVDKYALFKHEPKTHYALELFSSISAGFPSPAENYSEKTLDLNELCINNPPATFFVRVSGESMLNAGIFPGDILVVDRSLEASSDKIVVVAVDGEFTVKRLLVKSPDEVWLVPENDDMSPMQLTPSADTYVWGVVTFVIHQVS